MRFKIENIIAGFVMLLVIVWSLSPYVYAIITSVKKPTETYEATFIPFLQFEPTLETWISLVRMGREIFQGFKNSLIIALGSSALSILLGLFAAYSLATFQFQKPKNRDLFLWFLSQYIMPPATVVIPFFLIMKTLNLLDTPLAVIIAHTIFNLPFAVLIMRDAFKSVPKELRESALVDGCTEFKALSRVILPLVAPSLVAVFLICFAFSWNEFIFALILSYDEARTLPVVIQVSVMQVEIQFWMISAKTLVSILPPSILGLFISKYIVRGLTFGAVKG